MKVCYASHPYVSHRRAASAYRRCLAAENVALTHDPQLADLWIWHCEPWAIPGYERAFRTHERRPVAAYSVWEADVLPDDYHRFLSVADEIWTASSYSAAVLGQAGRPVAVVPHVVDPPQCPPDAIRSMRERIGSADCFVFYCIGSFGDRRKGQADVVSAFARLFDPAVARLVVKSPSPLPSDLAELPGVIGINGWLSDDEISALHLTGDCLVSLHRSEGFGLHIAEAMSAGRLVIATAHGGNMDFMTAANSVPVPCSVENIRGSDLQPGSRFTAEMKWGYADLAAAREAMISAVMDRERGRDRGERASRDMQRYSTSAMSGTVAAEARRLAGRG
ncbi:MAG: glycosyltransferase [Gemmatimonadota bacterium]